MYCSTCGQQLQEGQQVCPKCGRPVTMPPAATQAGPPPAGLFPSRVERHVQTLAILWLVYAGWLLVTWAFAATFFAGMLGMHRPWGPVGPMGPFGPGFPFMHMPWMLPFITFMLVGRSILGILTGIALIRHERWGRTLALVAGFLALIKPLSGTALGIYTLWVLLPSESAREYEELVG
ncbi:MAG TPA: zinc ribbon domain-containing protein [Acidisarcina sp.]|nr:zinc ribbon domain-containing protein [Acidisarcina sp.]